MLYNLFAVLILLGWIFSGVYALDFISGKIGENARGRKWLNLAAVFFGPFVLLGVWASSAFRKEESGEAGASVPVVVRGKGKRGAPVALLTDRAGNPVMPLDNRPPAVEAMETVYQLMQEAVERKATRVIVQPDLEGEYHVRFRIDGAEENISSLGALQGGSLVSAFKHAAGMSTSERRSSQSGGFFLQTGKAPLNCPAQSSRSGGGEQIVVRLGTIEAVPPLEGLGIPAGGLAELRELLGGGSGLVLLLGRPGSGLTTTMYSILQSPELAERRIASFESPVEFKLDNVMQNEVDPHRGNTLLKLLGNAINDGADTLAVGNLNDAESARLTVNFARNGKLSIAVLDCATPLEAFARFEKWEITPRMLGGMPLCLLSQALARKTGGGYAAVFDLPDRSALDSALETKGVTIDMVRQAIGKGGDGTGLMEELDILVNDGTITRDEAARVVKTIARKGE